MSKRIDYEQIAAKLDYATLNKKLEQSSEPPKNRKTAVDLLEPLRERLLALQHKGWSSKQLVDELKAAGVPVSPARLRECLNHWTTGGARRRGSNRSKRAAAQNAPQPASNQADGARAHRATASRNLDYLEPDEMLNAAQS